MDKGCRYGTPFVILIKNFHDDSNEILVSDKLLRILRKKRTSPYEALDQIAAYLNEAADALESYLS